MQPSTVGARAPAGGAPPEQQNWLQEWAGRTPLACRALIYAVLPLSLASFLAGWSPALNVVPARVVLAGEVWRLFSSVLAQDGLLTLVIVLVMLGVVLPPMELRRGTLPFALRLLSSALLINVAYCLLGTALAAVPWRALRDFGSKPGLGLWPVLLMLIAEDKLLDPAGETAFLCFKVNNRQYPWVLALVFSLLSFFPLLDLFLGVALGHAHHYNLTSFLTPSARRIEAWETAQGSWPVRLGLTRAMGYVQAPSTALPAAGGNAEAREAMTQFWSTFSLSNMGQRQAPAQGAGAGAGAGAEAGEEGGGGSGGGSVFRLGSGARAPPAPGSFTGQGRVLGAGGASAAAAPGPAGAGPVDADARRALAAAAAEARMQASSRSQRGAAAAAPAPAAAAASAAAAAEAASGAASSGFASSADAASSENEPLLHFSAPQQQQQQRQPPAHSDEYSASLRACLEMGFSEEASQRALAQSKGDLPQAIDLLASA